VPFLKAVFRKTKDRCTYTETCCGWMIFAPPIKDAPGGIPYSQLFERRSDAMDYWEWKTGSNPDYKVLKVKQVLTKVWKLPKTRKAKGKQ